MHRLQGTQRGRGRGVSAVASRTALRAGGSPQQAAATAPLLPYRVGHGWDLHRLEPGYPLIIGGIDIPHDRGCVAHSDGGRTVGGKVGLLGMAQAMEG